MSSITDSYTPQGVRFDLPYLLPAELVQRAEREGTPDPEEATTIRDAFESLTNGMVGNREGVKTIRNAGLQPWCGLIAAMEELYQGHGEEAEKLVKRLDPASAPGYLRPVLLALCGDEEAKEKRKEYRGAEKQLYNQVAEDQRFVKSVVIQLNDSLEAGEEYFHEFSLLALKELDELNRDLSRRLALWVLQKFYHEDFDYALLLENLKRLFPPAEVMRLSALILTPEDREEGIKCWLLSLLFRCREGSVSREEAAEYLWLVSQLMTVSCLLDEEDLYQLLQLIRKELETLFTLPLAPMDPGQPLYHSPRVWAAFLAPHVQPLFHQKAPGGNGRPEKTVSSPLVQLELFSCPDEPEEPVDLPPLEDIVDFSREVTRHGLFSPPPLKNPEELKTLLRPRPRYVGPEPWLETIRQKRNQQFRRG